MRKPFPPTASWKRLVFLFRHAIEASTRLWEDPDLRRYLFEGIYDRGGRDGRH